MHKPSVSIITPVYNAERFVADTIRSAQAQTFSDWEMILINDCSTDNSVQVIQPLLESDARLRLIEMPKNGGAAVARNAGMAIAAGRYVAFLDADDQWLPQKLEQQIAFMQKTGCALCYAAYTVMQEDGSDTGRTIHCPPTLSYRQLLMENRIGCLTAVVDTQQTGKMTMPLINKRQDYGLWLNILKQGFTACGIQEPLARYRKYSSSLSGNKWQTIGYNWTLLRQHQGLNIFRAAWYFFLFLVNKTVMAVIRRIIPARR